MRFASMLCFILASSLTTVAGACDKKGATVAQGQFVTMGDIEPGVFRWSSHMQSMPEQMRANLMESYAKIDACLHGKPRTIRFYQGDKPIGQVGIDGWFVPLDPKYDLPTRPGIHIWMSGHIKES
jgi:hypothetical protein